ncbi:MAG: hypothetical protein ACR2IF_07975 [Terriglobales bacterium]
MQHKNVSRALIGIGALVTFGSWILRSPSFLIVNGWYIETWRLELTAGLLVLSLGVVVSVKNQTARRHDQPQSGGIR